MLVEPRRRSSTVSHVILEMTPIIMGIPMSHQSSTGGSLLTDLTRHDVRARRNSFHETLNLHPHLPQLSVTSVSSNPCSTPT